MPSKNASSNRSPPLRRRRSKKKRSQSSYESRETSHFSRLVVMGGVTQCRRARTPGDLALRSMSSVVKLLDLSAQDCAQAVNEPPDPFFDGLLLQRPIGHSEV